MGLFSYFKRRRRTLNPGFQSYKNPRIAKRKAFVPKTSFFQKSPDRSPKNRRFGETGGKLLRYFKIFSAFFAIGAGIYLIFFTNFFTIQKIDIQGGEETVEEQKIINDYLQAYLGGNILMFDPSEHEKKLAENLGYLKTLGIYRVLPHTVVAKIETYPLVANVRIDQPDGSGKLYIVNELGYVALIGTSNVNLPTIVMDVTGTDLEIKEGDTTDGPKVNAEIIPAENLKEILDAKTSFEGKFDLQIKEVNYLKRARELHFLTELDFYVWLDMTQDIELQMSKMKKAMTKLSIYESPISYIDLRISGHDGEKVIYKLKE